MPALTEAGLWGRADLLRRLAATLDLAAAAFPHLTRLPSTACDARSFFARTKYVCETALLLHAASRVGDRVEIDPRVAALADRLAALARDEQTLSWMRLRPALLPELSVAHRALTLLGRPDPVFESSMHAIAAASTVGLPERQAWKDLEADWHAGLGVPVPPLDAPAALRRTALGHRQDGLFARREDVYSFTHALIYATDFGHRPAELPRPPADLLDDASAALSRCLDEDDFDLGAEVLLSWPYLRAPWSPAAWFGLTVLGRTEDTVGILPSMTLRAEVFAGLSTDEGARYFYAEGYHTAYVMGLLAAALLLPGAPVPLELGRHASAADVSAAAALADLLVGVQKVPQWQLLFEELPPAQRADLLPLLADVGVRRAVRASDFRLLQRVLVTFLGTGAPASSAVVQGVELLDRLAAVR